MDAREGFDIENFVVYKMIHIDGGRGQTKKDKSIRNFFEHTESDIEGGRGRERRKG